MSPDLLLAAALVAATPVLFAALGELLAERSGVLNLGLEGTMLIGAVNGFAATQGFGSVWAGIAAALVAGALFGLAFAFLVVTLRLDQVVTGLAFTILGAGLSAFIGKPYVGMAPRATVPTPDLGPLGDLPFLGRVLFSQDVLVYVALALTGAVAFYLKQTRPGLVLRALGESPDVLDTLGMPVAALRYAYVVTGTALAGLGGAYLSLAFTPSWIENMTAGRGWIALALVIFATWNPLRALFGALFFGCLDVLAFRAQIIGVDVQPTILGMIPYAATFAVLLGISALGVGRRLGAPAALGEPYVRGGGRAPRRGRRARRALSADQLALEAVELVDELVPQSSFLVVRHPGGLDPVQGELAHLGRLPFRGLDHFGVLTPDVRVEHRRVIRVDGHVQALGDHLPNRV
jgi:general nucleoside transport system permease protein